MKKSVLLSLAVCICLSIGIMLTACGNEHEHNYKTEWTFDDMYHWYACQKENCDATSEKANHSFENNICSICGYAQTIPEPPPLASTNAVSEEVFYQALSFDAVESLTVYEEFSNMVVGATTESVYYESYYFDGNKIKIITLFDSESEIEYREAFDTYTYVFEYHKENDKWIRNKSEYSYGGISDFFDFDDFDFSEWSYSDGAYTTTIPVSEESEMEYMVTAKLQFSGERLVYLRMETEIDGTPQYQAMSFVDYNKTSVILPTDYEDVTPEEQKPISAETWASYFDLEDVNVKIGLGIEEDEPDLVPAPYPTEYLTTNGDVWLWNGCYQFYKGIVYPHFEVCYDGENTYARGFLDNDFISQKQLFLAGTDFSDYQTHFIVEHRSNDDSYIVFVSDGFTATNGNVYEDVEICVIDGKLSYIKYLLTSANMQNQKRILYSFEDWNTIEVDIEKYTTLSEWNALLTSIM